MIQATQSWNSTKRMVSFLLSVSRRIVAIVAVHGTYSRQNTISARALAVPNPILFKATSAVLMPCAVAMFEIPKRTPQLETTTSLAAIPAISATMICHLRLLLLYLSCHSGGVWERYQYGQKNAKKRAI